MENRINKILTIMITFTMIYGMCFVYTYAKNEKTQAEIITKMEAEQSASNKQILEQIEEVKALTQENKSYIDEVYEQQVEIKLIEMKYEMEAVDRITDMKERFLTYLAVSEKYEEYIGYPTTIYDYYEDEEIKLLQRMVETETCGASFEARVNVANVAFNRLANESWPNDLTSVITQPGQFAYGRTMISEDTILAVEYAFMFPDTTQGALSFHSNAKTNTFGKYTYIFTDSAGHNFYGEE